MQLEKQACSQIKISTEVLSIYVRLGNNNYVYIYSSKKYIFTA